MENQFDPINLEEADSLCMRARSRAAGGPLSHAEVVSYLALLADERWVPDPNDPPSYDWSGGPALAGGSEMQVRKEVAKALRTCGGEELARVLESNLFGSSTDSEREYFGCLAVELLGPSHSFVLGLLRHESPMIRELAIGRFASLGWKNHENTVLLSPLLIDESDAVVARAVAIFSNLQTWFKAVPAGSLPADMINVAVERLKTTTGSRKLRLESFALVALLTESWPELASVLRTIPADERQMMIAKECFGATAIKHLLGIEPSLRPLLKSAVFEKFKSGAVGKRYYVVSEVCLFAPDADAFELALSEVRFRTDCVSDLRRFLESSPEFMPPLVEAAFERPRETQGDAVGFRDLMQCNPEAFAQAIADAPASSELRLKKLDKILNCLSSSRDAEMLMSTLRVNLIRLASGVKKSKPKQTKSKVTVFPEQSNTKKPTCFNPWIGSVVESWRSGAVRDAIHQFWREPSKGLQAVADTLESSSCDCLYLLEHLRSDRPHQKGCWLNAVLRQLAMTSAVEKSWAKKDDAWCWHNAQDQIDFSLANNENGEVGNIPILSGSWNSARLKLAADLGGPFGLFLINATADALLGVSHFVNMVALGIVHKGRRNLKGFESLAHLPNLMRLELRGAGITDLTVDEITGLGQLRYLGFLNSQVSDVGLESIRQLNGLETLNLPSCQRLSNQGLPTIARMSNLRVLNLASTQVTDDGLQSLEALVNLEQLCLSWNRGTTDVGAEILSRLPSLKYLLLFRASLSDVGLAHLSHCSTLEKLMIRETEVTSSGIRSLSKMRLLKVLNVSATKIGNEGMDHLSECQGLEELDVSNTQVGDQGLRSICSLDRLRILNLEQTRVTGDGMQHLEKLANLEVLSLANLRITDTGLTHLCSLKKLSELKISGTQITDRSLESIALIPSLNVVHLGANTNLSESAVGKLRERLPYCDVRWYPPAPKPQSPMDMIRDLWR